MDDSAAGFSDCREHESRPVFVAAAMSLALGAAVVFGWTFDLAALKTVVPGWAPMKANTAIGFLLLGAVLAASQRSRPISRFVAFAAGVMLVALSAGTLLEYALNCNLGIDELLFREEIARPTRLFQPGRMSPLAAVSFLLLVAALSLAADRRPLAHWGQQFCMFIPLVVSARTVVGQLYGVPALCQLGQWGPMALHTSLAFVLVSVCLLLSRRDYCLAVLLNGGDAGSRVVRRTLFAAMGAIFLLGLACLQAEQAGLFPVRYGLTVFVVLLVLALIGLAIPPCRFINQLDRQHELATQAAQRFRRASEVDALTGLFNRRGFLDRAEQELAAARLTGARLTCLMLDIDFFKKINDVHGHNAGDQVLCQFAAILNAGCREGDLVGRMGGEEFCVLLPGTDEIQALRLAEDLRVEIMNQRLSVDGLSVHGTHLTITASGGVAELRPSQASIHSLIDSADTALLLAKRTGRNRILTASALEEAELSDANRGPLSSARAEDIMLPAVAYVHSDWPLEKAARQLVELNLDSLPVVDRDGKVQGLITEQDLVSALLDRASPGKQVRDCQHTNVVVFQESTPAEEIATFFARTSIQRAVIVGGGMPVGLVSRRTMLRWLLNDLLSKRSFAGHSVCASKDERDDETERAILDLTQSVSRLARLHRFGQDEPIGPSLVGEATRIQHFVEALLTSSRAASAGGALRDLLAVGAMAIG